MQLTHLSQIVGLCLALLLPPVAWAEIGDFSNNSPCTDVDTGTWVTSADGQFMVDYSGTFGGGTASLYLLREDGSVKEIPNSAATDDTTSPFPVTTGAGAQLCVALAGATTPDFHWEVFPLRFRDENTNQLQYRY